MRERFLRPILLALGSAVVLASPALAGQGEPDRGGKGEWLNLMLREKMQPMFS